MPLKWAANSGYCFIIIIFLFLHMECPLCVAGVSWCVQTCRISLVSSNSPSRLAKRLVWSLLTLLPLPDRQAWNPMEGWACPLTTLPTFLSWDPSLLITPTGEKGEMDGRDIIGIRETRLSPHLEFTCSGGMISTTISQPLQLLPEEK